MDAFSNHGRHVLVHIVEQHAEEAAFLWIQRHRASNAPNHTRRTLMRLDRRVEAHLDGLRIAGPAGIHIAAAQLRDQPGPGQLFAVAVLALEAGDVAMITSLMPLAARLPAGFIGALAWCSPATLAPLVGRFNRSEDPFEQYLAVCACSAHRAAPGPRIIEWLRADDPRLRSRALRLVGELGRDDLVDICLDAIDHTDPWIRFWAAWSAALLGDRAAVLASLQALAAAGHPAAIELASRAAGLEGGTRWVRAMAGNPALRHTMIMAAGHLGDPAVVPWLITCMEDPAHARVAGSAFTFITGANITDDGLDAPLPPSDDEPHQDQNLPLPDPVRVRQWWAIHASRFATGRRHLRGRPIDLAAQEDAWRTGTQIQRRAAALEIALAHRGALRDWRAPNHCGIPCG